MPTDKDLHVRLRVSASDGQVATDYQLVINSFFNGGPCFVCPNSITDDLLRQETDEEEIELAQSLVFPNPSSGTLHLVLQDSLSDYDLVEIIDLGGATQRKIILEAEDQTSHYLELDVSDLKPAAYILKLIGKNNNQSFTFVKQ